MVANLCVTSAVRAPMRAAAAAASQPAWPPPTTMTSKVASLMRAQVTRAAAKLSRHPQRQKLERSLTRCRRHGCQTTSLLAGVLASRCGQPNVSRETSPAYAPQPHFPMQNRPKISPSTSSTSTAPVIRPSASAARRRSSARSSNSSIGEPRNDASAARQRSSCWRCRRLGQRGRLLGLGADARARESRQSPRQAVEAEPGQRRDGDRAPRAAAARSCCPAGRTW